LRRSGISHARLMRESTDRVELALRADDAAAQSVATRIVENPAVFQLWESEHCGLMRHVADYSVLRNQMGALKQTGLNLIHGKALFEHLKKKEVRGTQRTDLIRHFYPTRGYTSAMVAAHGSYLRKACSLLCTVHVGADVVRDDTFLDPMQRYEDLYAEYFELYCRTQIEADGEESASEKSLLPLLKHQLNEWRWAIINPRQAAPRIRYESRMRQPTGDTQRLPTLKPVYLSRD
jgi:hypothetical protein